jgi:hypothetical protein
MYLYFIPTPPFKRPVVKILFAKVPPKKAYEEKLFWEFHLSARVMLKVQFVEFYAPFLVADTVAFFAQS